MDILTRGHLIKSIKNDLKRYDYLIEIKLKGKGKGLRYVNL